MIYAVITKNSDYIKVFKKLRIARGYVHLLPHEQTALIIRMDDGKVMYKSYGYKKKFSGKCI